MPTVADIIAGLTTIIQTTLPDYLPLSYRVDIDKNRNTQRQSRFAIRPLGLESLEGPLGTVGRLDLQQRFEIILTDSWNGRLSNDEEIITKTGVLIDDAIKAFNAIAPNKLRIGGIKNINQLSISDPDYVDEEKLIILPFTFNISYFRSI